MIKLFFRNSILIFCVCSFCACTINSIDELTGYDYQTIGDQNLLSIALVNDSLIYAAGGKRYYNGLLLKSTDYGATWDSIPNNVAKIFYDLSITDLGQVFVSTEDSKVMRQNNFTDEFQVIQFNTRPSWMTLHSCNFFGDSYGMVVGGYGNAVGGLLRTTDAFETYEMDSFEVELRAVFVTNEQTAYIAGYGIIMKTIDFGETWIPLNVEGDFFEDLYFPSEDIGYAIGQEGSIVKTEDAGENWETLRKGNNLSQAKHRFNSIYFEDNLTGYLVGEKGLYWQTTDGGINWQKFVLENENNLNDIVATSDLVFIVGDNGSIIKLAK